jgi:hypothetical protein
VHRVRRTVCWYQRHATGCWLVLAVLVGLLQTATYRYSMNPDGIAYLDMGDAYLRGDWTTALRSHWSPLYAWLLGAVLRLVQPSPDLEFPVVHVVNLVVYAAALGAFTFLLREILATLRSNDIAAPAHIRPPDWAWISVGYALFVWCTLQYLPLSLVTPDVLVAAFVYTICGVILRTRRRPGARSSALLGLLLGLGYLAKAPLLPLAVAFLASSIVILERRCHRIAHLTVASVALAVVALPFIAALSVANGRPTAGDSASLNYLWVIDDAPLVHWQGGPESMGQPLHRSELLLERPAVFAFDGPYAVTYTPWYAPEYWLAGAKPFIRLGGQVRAIGAGLEVYARIASDLGVVLASLVVLLSMRVGTWRGRPTGPSLVLLAPALAALAMYGLVLVEGRYVAPFVILLVLGVLMVVRLPNAGWSAALVARVSVIMLVVLVLQIISAAADPAGSLLSQAVQGRLLMPDVNAQVAAALRSAGVRPGDTVATGDRGFNAYWARLARVRIIAEVSGLDGAAILDADPAAREAAQRVLSAQRARAIVARTWPAQTGDPRWQPIDGTDYFYYLLQRG